MMGTTCKEPVGVVKRDSLCEKENETLKILGEARRHLYDLHRSIYGDCPVDEKTEEPQCLVHNIVLNNQMAKSILEEVLAIKEHF